MTLRAREELITNRVLGFWRSNLAVSPRSRSMMPRNSNYFPICRVVTADCPVIQAWPKLDQKLEPNFPLGEGVANSMVI